MVKIMETPIKMDDLGGPPLFLGWHPWRRLGYRGGACEDVSQDIACANSKGCGSCGGEKKPGNELIDILLMVQKSGEKTSWGW